MATFFEAKQKRDNSRKKGKNTERNANRRFCVTIGCDSDEQFTFFVLWKASCEKNKLAAHRHKQTNKQKHNVK